MKHVNFLLSVLIGLTLSGAARAEGLGIPHSWQVGFQDAASPIKSSIEHFHFQLLILITVITLFVLAFLIAIVFKFNAKRNPVPSKTTHNVPLEIIWTLVPALIVLVLMFPSMGLLKASGNIPPKPDMTLKVTGYQWYWGYEYPDQGGINFLSNMVAEKDIDASKGQRRLLETDNAVVVPVDTVIAVEVTAKDVLHSWAMPALGVKKDAVPGRLNMTWFKANKIGTYYGQCSEICGTGHAYMPIQIKVVSKEDFDAWVAEAKVKFADKSNEPLHLAAK